MLCLCGFELYSHWVPLLFEARNSGLKHKIDARFGIESMPVRWDAKNNHRHCGIAWKFWSGFPTGWKNLLRTLKANI